ncbi:Calcium-transporting ATPase-like protein [Emericellopsis cladophorae]|uniref:Calcium-transporting ATPase-like protein n=1 Tax=Emericellopsis cladophorae TaxID=2686198 RepID=A0A9P9XV35_9HYPO|nr:Calcium-transporting ATPase-like protein [Emericellopsis cladophorae]KAI6778362.1 Calcium-transporting ATPase-like protein [Emericellopsis cladophorae]
MSVVYDAPNSATGSIIEHNRSIIFVKGAIERVLNLCGYMGTGGEQDIVTEDIKEQVLHQMQHLASQGQHVLAIAYSSYGGRYRPHRAASPEEEAAVRADVESGFTLLGLAGIYDPPSRETKGANSEASHAGIKIHMLTGDHPETAKAIAKEVGIIPKNLGVLPDTVARSIVQKATNFDKMTDAEIDALPELPLVIARCAPDTKTRMIEALRRRDAFMAMMGDGAAAKIVLTDDKFNSRVSAIREGRRMFDNIQKFILHLLTSNMGGVILLMAGLGFTDSSGTSVFPISPLQVIRINMATSSFPAFGLGRQPAAQDIMRKPPHDKKRGVFTNQVIVDMIVYGVIMGICTMVPFCGIAYSAYGGELGHGYNEGYNPLCNAVFKARVATFAELIWLILISAWEFKSLRHSMFHLNPESKGQFDFFNDIYSNQFLFWSVIIGVLSVFPVVYIPYLNKDFFKHMDITWEWALAVGLTFVLVGGIELWKFIKRRFHLLEDRPVNHGPWGQGGSTNDDESSRVRRTMTMSSFKT